MPTTLKSRNHSIIRHHSQQQHKVSTEARARPLTPRDKICGWSPVLPLFPCVNYCCSFNSVADLSKDLWGLIFCCCHHVPGTRYQVPQLALTTSYQVLSTRIHTYQVATSTLSPCVSYRCRLSILGVKGICFPDCIYYLLEL